MGILEFIGAAEKKGIRVLNHFPPALRKHVETAEALFFFTCDDISAETGIKELKQLAGLLKRFAAKASFFVVPKMNGKTFTKQKALALKKILRGHEIAMHGITHEKGELLEENSEEMTAKLAAAKKEMEKLFGARIIGYRSPRFHWKRGLEDSLARAGFSYNSDSYFFEPAPWKTKSGLLVVPAESLCDPISEFKGNEEKVLGFMEKKLWQTKREKKQFVFLFHIQAISSKKNIELLEKILALAKQKGIPMELSLADFAEQKARR